MHEAPDVSVHTGSFISAVMGKQQQMWSVCESGITLGLYLILTRRNICILCEMDYFQLTLCIHLHSIIQIYNPVRYKNVSFTLLCFNSFI